MARAALGMSVRDLARTARVGTTMVVRFETGQANLIPATVAAIRRAFEDRGIHFLDERCVCAPGGGSERIAA